VEALGSLHSLSASIAARDPEAAGHAARVTALSERIARALGVDGAPLAALRVGGPLHDLGKLAVDETILNKPGPLDARELAEIRTHPVVGARMIETIEPLRAALACVLHHHERWDGDGYPTRLAGDAIPLEARILAVADAFDAMTSNRPYRAPLTTPEALDEVDRCTGSQFDPDVAEAFLALSARRRRQSA
jgi:putative nucleotidyltransferase with HDIG domain